MRPGLEVIGKIVVARTAPGAVHGIGEVISSCEAPTLGIRTADGSQFDWRADLCEEATNEQVEAYLERKASRNGEGLPGKFLDAMNRPAADHAAVVMTMMETLRALIVSGARVVSLNVGPIEGAALARAYSALLVEDRLVGFGFVSAGGRERMAGRGYAEVYATTESLDDPRAVYIEAPDSARPRPVEKRPDAWLVERRIGEAWRHSPTRDFFGARDERRGGRVAQLVAQLGAENVREVKLYRLADPAVAVEGGRS